MKEFFDLLLHFRLRALFVEPTENGFLQFFRYCFVGAVAFLVDNGVVWLFGANGLLVDGLCDILILQTVGFILGFLTNYALSKLFVFRQSARVGKAWEFVAYLVIGIIGLGIKYALTTWVFMGWMSMHEQLANILAAVIVLAWNFIARKIALYAKK